ncbi:MAG: NAD(P)-binding protein, partial [Clostridia bacterium]|nr:NAD(P)-binding protein [Clostridia bacterium]
MFNKEALVIGLGISGCAAARMLADAGYNVTCFEKESHIGGYLFEETRPNGIRVQSCGPHIFHTDNESVYAFLRRFGSFYPYTHRVLAQVDKKLVPLPLNRHSLEMLFGEERTALLLARIHAFWSDRKRIAVDELINSKDSHLADLGRYIVENILTININRKSSGSFAYADDSYMNDAYVDITEDDNYYEDSIQAMPMQGFMKVMEKMIDHPAIT